MSSSVLRADEVIATEGTFVTLNLPSGSIDNGDIAANADIVRSKFVQEANQIYPIRPDEWRNATAFQTVVGTPATNILGITTGAHGTAQPYLAAADCKTVTNASCSARTLFTLPPEYDDANTITLRMYAGMGTTSVADVSCTIDAVAYEVDKDCITQVASTDLITTAATDMNSPTIAAKDFAVSATNLVAGDVLDIKITVACNDAAGGSPVVPVISHAEMLVDIKG